MTHQKERDALKYDTSLDTVLRNEHYVRLLNLVGKNKKVLELGASTGFMSEALTKAYACDVTAVEIDAECAEVAKGKCSRVIVADLDHDDITEKLENEQFDVILCADVLEHLREPGRLLNKLKAKLKPEGYVVASIPHVAHGSIRLSLFAGQFPYRPKGLLDETHIKFFDRASIENMFVSAGFAPSIKGRNRWDVIHTEVGESLSSLCQPYASKLISDPELDTYQFIIEAYPYNENTALGRKQREALELSSPNNKNGLLPGIDVVLLETAQMPITDKFLSHLKLQNYPETRLRFHVMKSHNQESVPTLNDNPKEFNELDFSSFRFVENARIDRRTRDHFSSTDVREIPLLNRELFERYLRENLSSDYVFIADSQTYPTESCLKKSLEAFQQTVCDSLIILTTPELITSPNLLDWKRCIFTKRETFHRLVSLIHPKETVSLNKLTRQTADLQFITVGPDSSLFFYVGTAGPEDPIGNNIRSSQKNYPKLEPVISEEKRPFWSVIVPVYDRLEFLPQCLDSILSNAPPADEMEIIVHQDNHETDVESLVEKLGGSRVKFAKTASRLGLYGNTNEALKKSTGQWIHVLHDDDYVESDFYKIMRHAVDNLPDEFGAACCHYETFNTDDDSIWAPPRLRSTPGVLVNWLEAITCINKLNIPAVILRRSLFEEIGLFADDLHFTGDWEFWIRAAAHCKWWYQPEKLATWRVHAQSLSSTLKSQGETARNIKETFDRVEAFLPNSIIQTSVKPSRTRHAMSLIEIARECFEEGNDWLGVKVGFECLQIDPGIESSMEFAKLLGYLGAEPLRNAVLKWDGNCSA